MSTSQQVAVLPVLRNGFESGLMTNITDRISVLKALHQIIREEEQAIFEALYDDLHKGKEEAWVSELGIVLDEIKTAIRQLKKWARPKRVPTNMVNLPSSSYVYPEPLGVVLIIAPWNYPFMLLMAPLVSALSAGNTVALKPSEYAAATGLVIENIIRKLQSNRIVQVVTGVGAELVPAMMQQFRFDHVFFTGGTEVGKKIYELAAAQLVPVTLELGGKSPCVVEPDANLEVAARRITLGKFSNAGQICIAPDYLLVHESVKPALVMALQNALKTFYGNDPKSSPEFGRIINQQQFERLSSYLQNLPLITGGETDASERYLAPTLVELNSTDHPLMKEEIFGPVLPILTYKEKSEVVQIIRQHPNPLAFYLFTEDKKNVEWWLQHVRAGTCSINNTAWQFTNPHLPFGGRGNSGIGSAHGKFGFDQFTHFKSVLDTPTWFDPAIRYPPLDGKLSLFKKIIG